MEFTIIAYASVYLAIMDIIINTVGITSENVVFKDYCQGEVLKVNENVNTTGIYRINIVDPTLDTNTMKKLIGRSSMVYYINIVNMKDREMLYENFGHNYYSGGYRMMDTTGIFNISENSPVIRKFSAEYKEDMSKLERLVLDHFKLSQESSTTEFDKFRMGKE